MIYLRTYIIVRVTYIFILTARRRNPSPPPATPGRSDYRTDSHKMAARIIQYNIRYIMATVLYSRTCIDMAEK